MVKTRRMHTVQTIITCKLVHFLDLQLEDKAMNKLKVVTSNICTLWTIISEKFPINAQLAIAHALNSWFARVSRLCGLLQSWKWWCGWSSVGVLLAATLSCLGTLMFRASWLCGCLLHVCYVDPTQSAIPLPPCPLWATINNELCDHDYAFTSWKLVCAFTVRAASLANWCRPKVIYMSE